MSILQKFKSHAQTDRRVRLRGPLRVERFHHSRTLNRLFSSSSSLRDHAVWIHRTPVDLRMARTLRKSRWA